MLTQLFGNDHHILFKCFVDKSFPSKFVRLYMNYNVFFFFVDLLALKVTGYSLFMNNS